MAGPNAAGLPTGLDLITEALSILGVYAPGEAISAADSQSAYFTLQWLIDGWGAEALTIFRAYIFNFTTVAGQQAYNVGPAGATPPNDWIVPTLPTVFYAYGQLPMAGPTPVEIPLVPYTDLDWSAIGIKTLQSSYLQGVWPVYGGTNHTLYFWPVPATAIPVVIYAQQQVPRLTAISNLIGLQPGYVEALVYELAIKLSSKFGRPVPDWLPQAWTAAKSKIKESNFQPLDVSFDPALSSDGSRFNGGGSLDFYLGK